MKTFRRSDVYGFLHYLYAVCFVIGMTLFLRLVTPTLSIQNIVLFFLLPVVISSRQWGFGPGIMAAFCAFFCLNYFFISPYYTLIVHNPEDLLVLVIFLGVAIIVSQLMGRAKSSVVNARQREQEATRLYELSSAISGQQDIHLIQHIILEKIREIFHPQRVGIVLDQEWAPEPHFEPTEALKNPRPPEVSLSLMTARGELGRILLWRKQLLSEQEMRILRTIASHSALAVEQAALARVEARARVLEESDRLKSAILSSVSHELRTPLATIKASISSLRSSSVELDQAAREDLLLAIEEETDQLNQLVGNILDMSRIETGALNPIRKWNALSEIVNGVVKRMRQTLQQHRIEVDLPPDLPLLPVDYVQMDQVFTNLLSNSAKYAPPNSRIIISARLLTETEMVHIRVANEGPQVAEAHLDRIFDKFYRLEASDKVTGTGLGLSICKGIVEAHGGAIWAENEPGLFVFNFTLPINWQGALPILPEES